MFFNDYSNGGKLSNKYDTLKDLDAKTRKELSHILTFHPLKSQAKIFVSTSWIKLKLDIRVQYL